MKVRSPLQVLVRQLGSTTGERCIVAGAVAGLIRSRRRFLAATGRFLAPWARFSFSSKKIFLWGVVASVCSERSRPLDFDQKRRLLFAIQSTQAYRDAKSFVLYRRCAPYSRGLNYKELLPSL